MNIKQEHKNIIWTLMSLIELKCLSEFFPLLQVFSSVRGYVWRDKFYGTVYTERDTLHIEPLLNVGPVNTKYVRGVVRPVNAYGEERGRKYPTLNLIVFSLQSILQTEAETERQAQAVSEEAETDQSLQETAETEGEAEEEPSLEETEALELAGEAEEERWEAGQEMSELRPPPDR